MIFGAALPVWLKAVPDVVVILCQLVVAEINEERLVFWRRLKLIRRVRTAEIETPHLSSDARALRDAERVYFSSFQVFTESKQGSRGANEKKGVQIPGR